MYTVYIASNILTGHEYIGCTSNLTGRVYAHKSRMKNEPHKKWPLYQQMRKYGFTAFTFVPVGQFKSEATARKYERKLIVERAAHLNIQHNPKRKVNK